MTRRLLITGASSGIGRAAALLAAQHGFHVAVHYHRQVLATVKASIPLGRPAHVDEVAKPLLWLLSDEASFITGTTIDLSGGGFRIAG